MLNAIGLQNVGVDAFLREKLPELRALGVTVIANVWGDLEEDYVTVVRALEEAKGLAAIELEHLLPERRTRRNALRKLSGRHGVARGEGPCGDSAAR